MQKYIPKTDQDNGRNNSRRNYEDSRAIRKRSSRQIKQYAEIKMMKGHSEEQALKMAEEQITTKEW
jgi:hypothetical protein